MKSTGHSWARKDKIKGKKDKSIPDKAEQRVDGWMISVDEHNKRQ